MSGKVIDENGEPLAGATVLLVGSGNTYALTDLDGFWSMTAKLPAKVSVSYLGYVTKEVRIDSGSPVTVTLQEDMNMLDEIVVVGYGTMEKRAVTSSITSISSKDLLAGQGGSTIATALKGKISGMTITETSSPNTSSSMQLRGVASINAAASPLVVVDGVPGADIRSINFEDVLSVGLTVTPEVYFRTTFSNADLINARIDDEILSIFANGSYHFGAGIGLTLGMMYRYSDELSFSLDLRNLPRLSGSIYFLATEVSDFRFHADRNIYITAPDLAFSVRWDHERWHVDAELGNIVSGLLDWAFIDGLPFRCQDILGFRVGYDLTDYLILSVSYEDGLLGLGFEKGDWKADILTRIDKLAIGVRCRYEM